MTLLPQQGSPLDDVWVSLDLETTGLSPDGDEIIEVGAVKFQGDRTIDTFQSLVNPQLTLTQFIKRYTGITQEEVDRAPPFSTVARDLVPFIGRAPVVGHNLSFDLGFLASRGLRLPNPRCDTWDLAFVVLPENRDYSLRRLATLLGISHPRPHRAVEDALVTRELFLKLANMAADLDQFTLAEMERLASRSSWVLSYLLRRLEAHKPSATRDALPSPGPGQPSATGLDIRALRERFQHTRILRPNQHLEKLDVEKTAALLGKEGPVAAFMQGYEERPEQTAMARSVAEVINEGGRLLVEAGTGVGKSLAYLLPAAIYALTNNKRVVISTNTINLQEQLLSKDIPTLVSALRAENGDQLDEFRYVLLKGRANYLCLSRWLQLRSGESLTSDEARLLSKVLVWLRSTATGDRSELGMGHRSAAAPWERLSAQGALDCPGVHGVCFLRAARDRAASAHIVIVNHALLMSDLVAGRALIPDYDILIVDEAHHLEGEATRHLGFEVSQAGIDDYLQSLGGERGLLNTASAAVRLSRAAQTRGNTVTEAAGMINTLLLATREALAGMFYALNALLTGERDGDGVQETRITSATRAQPAWSQLEVQWENVDASLAELHKQLSGLSSSLDGLDLANVPAYEGLIMETLNSVQRANELRNRLSEFVPQPRSDGVYWVTPADGRGNVVLHSAPLHVGEQLEKLLYSQKESVILTSATLSTDGTFSHIRERTGFEDADELLLGSPFDYSRAAILCVPEDMPEPASWAYQPAVNQAIIDAAVAAGGRAMALFTSHAALQTAAAAIRGALDARGLSLLAQGVDGPPHQLLRSFLENPQSVLLGTASFWEGVDLAGESLKVLLVARLPFSVPTEPVFQSRSELYEEPFNGYAVPQAILRIRQGFGRLIRTKSDKGVVAILDRRIVSRGYGKAFIRSLPPVTLKTGKLSELGSVIASWLGA